VGFGGEEKEHGRSCGAPRGGVGEPGVRPVKEEKHMAMDMSVGCTEKHNVRYVWGYLVAWRVWRVCAGF
jgi:hypothetical protein